MGKERRRWKNLVTLLTLGACCLLAARSTRWLVWQALNAMLRRKFSAVPRISTSELATWLDDPRRPPPRLLDVRETTEYGLSHLVGARSITPTYDLAALNLPKDAPVVTYCSVGYRSARFASRLQRAGFTNVRNLEGSIFAWANEDRPLVGTDGQPATRVHPYNGTWGLLLRPAHRAVAPLAA